MTIRNRLEKPKQEIVDVDGLIDKGAKVKEDEVEEKKWAYVNIRIPVKMLERVDVAVSVSERIGIRRTSWILEAISEKLKREKQ